MPVRVAVLASGGGTNLQAILDYTATRTDAAASQVVLVASNRSEAGALARARTAGIAAESFDHADEGQSLLKLLRSHAIDLVVLAGYLKRVPSAVIRAYGSRILNIHPAPLPRFGGPGMYGAKVHAAVIGAGATSTGVTVHFVDEEIDAGPVVAFWPVPILDGDTPDTLAARVLECEHLVYPRIVDMVASLIGSGFSADF